MWAVYLFFGFLGGVLGGLGMGGGTVLVPLLGFTQLGQKSIQAINLISFIPMATVSLIIHSKNGLVEKKGLFTLIFPAVIFSVLGGVIAGIVKAKFLKKCFGVFLIGVAVYSMLFSKTDKSQKSLKKSKKKSKKNF